jgi:hypothetical protein
MIGLFCLALVACGGTKTLTVPATVNVTDPAKIIAVIQATERVLTRRIASAELGNAVVSVIPSLGANAIVTIKLPDDEAVEIAKKILSEEFTFEIKVLTSTEKGSDGIEESVWEPTGLDGGSLIWIQPIRHTDTGELGLELQFNDTGREILRSSFQKNEGKDIGIFVRDLLVSKMTIGSSDIGESIVINGIPSSKVAEIFADDVNVGLHVSYSVSK